MREVTAIADTLRAHRQKVAVIIATDGESSDGNVANAIEPLINVSAYNYYSHFIKTCMF